MYIKATVTVERQTMSTKIVNGCKRLYVRVLNSFRGESIRAASCVRGTDMGKWSV